jgi:hypothetical protein
MISWFNMKKTSVALSTTKVECIAACSTRSGTVWPQNLPTGFVDIELEETCIWCDNQSCVKVIENLVFHENS